MRLVAFALAAAVLAAPQAHAGRAIRVGAAADEVKVGQEAPEPTRDTLKLAVVAVQGRKLGKNDAAHLARYFSQRTRRKVEAELFSDYDAAANALVEKRADVAWLPPLQGYNAKLGGARPLAKLTRDGRDYYLPVIFNHMKSAPTSLKELNHVRAAWVDRNSATGYVFAAAKLDAENVPFKALDAQDFLGSHEAVCKAVASGKADVGATFVDDRGPRKPLQLDGCVQTIGKRRASDLRVLAVGERVPSDAFFTRNGLPEPARKLFEAAVLEMARASEGRRLLKNVLRADGLAPCGDEDFTSVQRALEAASAWDR
jgi:phosphonate transport system substrate-binding protein